MQYTNIFFDLDITLYTSDCGLWEVINNRINKFILTRLKVPQKEIPALRLYCHQNFATTLPGLMSNFDINVDDYLAFVHDVDLSKFFKPDIQVREVLLQYPQRRFIFTNADHNHALRVISALNLNDIFEFIIDIHNINPHNKFQEEAFHTTLQIAGSSELSKCIMVDDMARVLDIAKNLGLYTIYVNKNPPTESNHATIREIEELPLVLNPD